MTTLLLLAPILPPVVAAAGHALVGWRWFSAWFGIATTALVLVDAVALAVVVMRDGPVSIAGGLLRADALSVWLLLVVAAVALLACWASPAYLSAGHSGERR